MYRLNISTVLVFGCSVVTDVGTELACFHTGCFRIGTWLRTALKTVVAYGNDTSCPGIHAIPPGQADRLRVSARSMHNAAELRCAEIGRRNFMAPESGRRRRAERRMETPLRVAMHQSWTV